MDYKKFKTLLNESKQSRQTTLLQKLYMWDICHTHIKSKEVQLKYHKIKISVYKNTDTDYYELHISSLLDPNIKGYVLYETQDDVNMIYDNLKGVGYIVDYIFNNAKSNEHCIDWSRIIVDELKVINLGKDKFDHKDIDIIAASRTYSANPKLPGK